MASNKLKAKQIEAYRGQGTLQDGDGLMLRDGRWVLRIQVDGKRRDLGLGGVADVTLKMARERAAEARRKATSGKECGTFGTAQATFKDTWEQFWQLKKPQLSNGKHVWQWTQTMEAYVLPAIGARPVADVRPPEIIAIIKPIWHEKHVTASRLLQRIDSVFEHAIVTELRERANPCTGVAKRLGSKREAPRHFRALPYADVPALMARLRAMPATPARLCLQWTILTACRAGEGRFAVAEEVTDRQWTIPAERTKMRRPHVVPLSDAALEVLEHAAKLPRPEGCRYLFPTPAGEALSDMSMTMLVRKLGLGEATTVHGLRSSFRDWAGEAFRAREVVAEACLAHVVSNKTEAAYARATYLEERRKLMAAWGGYLTTERVAAAA
jgi:integrase